MGLLLSVKGLQKSFGARPLFENLSFVVAEKERIGLIGSNGAGKSTLLKIISGHIDPDEGEISVPKGIKIGFLEQSPRFGSENTIEDEILSGAPEQNSSEAQALTLELISKLNLESQGYEPKTKVAVLSGGWQKKVALARELVKQPQILLLDEPTNHLDLESILWLEDFLIRSPFATVVITHDRVFLQKVTNRIFELGRQFPGGVFDVRGNYLNYLEQRDSQLSQQKAEELVLKNKLRRETEWLRRGPKARTTKQQARIDRAASLKGEVEELQYRNKSREVSIEFQSLTKQPKRLIEAKNISKSYEGKKLFSDFSIFIGPGSRVGLLGVNGCGKSTLIRCLLGQDKVDSGTIVLAEKLSVAYFEQKRESLDPNLSVKETLCSGGDSVVYRGKPIHVRGYLDRFLFSPEQVELPVGKLSGGEQARLLLAKLMLTEAKVLVLDEPTNDLDIETLNVLQNCLTEFEGAVILVTHDRFFLDQVTTEIIAFPSQKKDGILIRFSDLAQWELWKEQKQTSQENKDPKATQENSNKKKKMSYHEVRELSGMEQKIQEAENKLEQLQKDSNMLSVQSDSKKLSELYEQMALIQKEIDRLYSRWAELEAKSNAG